MSGTGPLQGVRVVDIASSYAAPTASMYLADMGADVIKIEPLRGDDARGWGPPFLNGEAAWFLSVNRNKRSMCLDLRSEQGREVLFQLLATADVFIENIVPTKLEKHGLGLDGSARAFPTAGDLRVLGLRTGRSGRVASRATTSSPRRAPD